MSKRLGVLVLCAVIGMGCVPRSRELAGGDVRNAANEVDLVVVNARVWTGDPAKPAATSFAVKDGRFVRIGDDAAIQSLAGQSTKVVDAGQRRVIPGICDSHLHLVSGGLFLSRINLRKAANRDEFIEAVRLAAERLPPGDWMQGGRWSTESWPDPAQPTKAWIDDVTGERPVLLSRMDGHGALANSAALRIAGIDRAGPADPIGGLIERDLATREPTGILKDTAIELVSRHVPAPSADALANALQAAMEEANRHGVTSVHTMSEWSDMRAIEAAQAAGDLTLRIRVYVSEGDWQAHLAGIQAFEARAAQTGDEWVKICGFKEYADGSLGSRSAYMAAAFADQPENRGLARPVLMIPGALEAKCRMAVENGLAPAIHAIGDQANHEVLDVYERVVGANKGRVGKSAVRGRSPSETAPTLPGHGVRPRIEHAQHLLPADIERFARLGVVASMQPLHKADDGRYAEQAIGTQRCRTSYAFDSLLKAGACVAFGSDWPVVSLNPFPGIHAAVTGKTLDGKVFVPQQNISVEQALACYTSGGPQAAGDENKLGSIREGFLADFVVLEEDVLGMSPDSITGVGVVSTFISGRQVWP
jgi:predicted amidohydrolase YtcJ